LFLELRLEEILKEGDLRSVPHDSWANSYDQLFEASFGSHLANLTDLTMEIVLELSEPSESILDIGAGTGRMSLPLIESNFYVSSLDPSAGMLSQLAKKLPNHPNLELIHCPVAELEMHERHHGALCIFTVSSYWLDESTLANSLRSIYNALLPNGWLIIDRTLKSSFSDTVFQNEKIHRQAIIEDLGGDLYRFTEQSTISSSNNIKQINDSFLIRYWEEDLFLDHVKATGFNIEQDLSQVFSSSGASFYLLRKD
jgi:ubiquinone/menaquinone biosynthesis C-methylase UbiE